MKQMHPVTEFKPVWRFLCCLFQILQHRGSGSISSAPTLSSVIDCDLENMPLFLETLNFTILDVEF